MRNIKLVVSYDGTDYCGFQIQPRGKTIQGELERALQRLTGEQTKMHSSGRTDAGVHARKQVVNFVTEAEIPVERWAVALNSRLPHDIVVSEAAEVPLRFHARKSAKRKTYRYFIQTGKFADVFSRRTHIHHYRKLDVAAMQAAITHFVGEHDFKSFCSNQTKKESYIRTVYDARLHSEPFSSAGAWGDAALVRIDVTGNGFLHNMVRIIVGTLIEVGEGRRSAYDIPRILAAKDRLAAGPLAMAKGLILWDVFYDIDDERC